LWILPHTTWQPVDGAGIGFSGVCVIFLLERRLSSNLRQRDVQAMEKFMGLLLNHVAVNKILTVIKEYLS
jgi:small neutral amino acid transporter SnatA (MarC family)